MPNRIFIGKFFLDKSQVLIKIPTFLAHSSFILFLISYEISIKFSGFSTHFDLIQNQYFGYIWHSFTFFKDNKFKMHKKLKITMSVLSNSSSNLAQESRNSLIPNVKLKSKRKQNETKRNKVTFFT